MNHTTYRMRRRVGAALLAGVSALGVAGVAALAGAGSAAAATAPTVTATSLGNSTINGSAAGQSAGGISLSINGSISAGDRIDLTIACPSTGLVGFTADPSSATSAGGSWLGAGAGLVSTGNCGASNDELVLVAPAAATNATVTISGITLTTLGAPSGSVSISGTYATFGAQSSFTVPTIATITWYGVTADVPPVTLPSTASGQSVSNVSIAVPSSMTGSMLTGTAGTTESVSLTLTNATFASTPTFSVIPSTAVTLATPPVSLGSGNLTATATFTTTTTGSANFTFSGISVTPTGNGPIYGNLMVSPSPTGSTGVIAYKITLAGYQGPSNRIYGQTPDATVAQEFEAAFPVTSGGNKTVVLATNVDPFDALSASYLEGQLGTGLLITPPTSLGSQALNAMRLEGVQTVYIVGGPDAVSPNVVSQIESTPAYNVGGVTTTGSDIKVAAQIYGQTAADTASAIATYFGTAYGSLPATPGAYNSTVGTYNDTTGNASTTAPSGTVPTAFVIAETDYRDAVALGPIAYAYRIPILLTPATSLGTQASTALTSLGIKQVIVVGGQLALTNSVVTSIQGLNSGISVLRIAGQDYTDTATQVAKFELSTTAGAGLNWGTTPSGMSAGFLLSHGDYWSDALGAAALGGQSGLTLNGTKYTYEPILLTLNPTTVGSYLNAYATSLAPSTAAVNVLGGPLAVTSTVVASVQSALAS